MQIDLPTGIFLYLLAGALLVATAVLCDSTVETEGVRFRKSAIGVAGIAVLLWPWFFLLSAATAIFYTRLRRAERKQAAKDLEAGSLREDILRRAAHEARAIARAEAERWAQFESIRRELNKQKA